MISRPVPPVAPSTSSFTSAPLWKDDRRGGEPGHGGPASSRPLESDESLLPASSQSLIELDQGNEFVAFGLGQVQFRREIVRVVGKDLEVVGSSGLEPHL